MKKDDIVAKKRFSYVAKPVFKRKAVAVKCETLLAAVDAMDRRMVEFGRQLFVENAKQ